MSNIAVMFASHRKNGLSKELTEILKEYKQHNFEIIKLSETGFEPCVHCLRCSITGKCMRHPDTFNETVEKLRSAEAIIFVSPLYTPVPSRFSAFLERLTSIGYFYRMKNGGSGGPLKGKRCAVICYDSTGVNGMLEGLIKQVLKPCLIDSSEVNLSVIDGIFIAEYKELETLNMDVSTYMRYVLNRI